MDFGVTSFITLWQLWSVDITTRSVIHIILYHSTAVYIANGILQFHYQWSSWGIRECASMHSLCKDIRSKVIH